MEQMNQLLHLPDSYFAQYCERKYSINKESYNIIDDWFYKKGIVNIIDRRTKLIQFMNAYLLNAENVTFGPAGLNKALEDFWNEQQKLSLANWFTLKNRYLTGIFRRTF